jgi:serine/threonine protein phosphatase PrpC
MKMIFLKGLKNKKALIPETKILSDKGKRKNNEDYAAYNFVDDYYCWVVCDGLGGHDAGEIASKVVANTIVSGFCEKPSIEKEDISAYIQEAQDELTSLQKENKLCENMKTTLVAGFSDGENFRYAHIGDSRLYYFRNRKILFQTLDHSVPQMLVNLGESKKEDIRTHEDRNRLLKVMGTEWDKPKYEISENIIDIKKDDAILLCTDGFWEYVYEKEMISLLEESKSVDKWLQNMKRKIENGTKEIENDNYTAIGIKFIEK